MFYKNVRVLDPTGVLNRPGSLLLFYLFIYGCVGSSFLCEDFSLIAASGGHSSSRCAGLSLSRPLLLRSTGSRRTGSVVVAHGLSCSAACGIFPDQGSNPCPLHWQADSQPLRHQGSPAFLNAGRCRTPTARSGLWMDPAQPPSPADWGGGAAPGWLSFESRLCHLQLCDLRRLPPEWGSHWDPLKRLSGD